MKLIKAYINNFGKFSDYTVDFTDGLNSFIYENGWGKSTFAVFIKSMFYGMEHTTSKDLDKNEKLKYTPWQGGTYGGSLTFSHNGKNYRITRTFSDKKNSDTFELLDTDINKLSFDYSDNIGNELFGVNRETFTRSLFVVLDKAPENSPDISAKLNNLIEAADVNNFDKAFADLEAKAKEIKPKKGSGGKILALENQIDADRNILTEIQGKLSQNDVLEKKISSIKKEVESLKENQNVLTKELGVVAKYESKLRYDALQKDLSDAKKELVQEEAFFNGKVPANEEVEKLNSCMQNYVRIEANLESVSLKQTEKDQYANLLSFFDGDVPDHTQVTKAVELNSTLTSFQKDENQKKLSDSDQKELENLKGIFAGTNVSKELIDSNINLLSTVQANKTRLLELQSREQQKQNEAKIAQLSNKTSPLTLVCIIISVLSLMAFVTTLYLKLLPVPLLCAFVSVFCMLMGLLTRKKQKVPQNEEEIAPLQKDINELQLQIQLLEQKLNTFVTGILPESQADIAALTNIKVLYEKYSNLLGKEDIYKKWIGALNFNPVQIEEELKVFAKRYCHSQELTNISTDIQILNDRLNRLTALEEKINKATKNSRELEEAKKILSASLCEYNVQKLDSFSNQVAQVHSKLTKIEALNSNIKNIKQKIDEFEAMSENNMDELLKLKKPERSVEQIKAELDEVAGDINEKSEIIASYQKVIDDNCALTDKKDEYENEIESLQLLRQEKKEEWENLTKTMEFLAKAKERLDANYSAPMKKSFQKYTELLGCSLDLLIDTDLNVMQDEKGQVHDKEYLSAGYKDLVNFCSRMALCDSLFKDFAPPVILDDPFVNLDDAKIPKALQLIKTLSKERQIIYFACHESRSLDRNEQ